MRTGTTEKHRVVWTRVMARFMFINASMALVFSVISESYSRVYIISQSARILCYLLFFVLSRVRRNKGFYLPVLSEMSEENYWGLASLVLVVLRLTITGVSPEYGAIFQAIDIIFATIGVTYAFMAYARRGWTARDENLRERRIQFLARKAKISKKEFETIKGTLIEAARSQQRMPVMWSLALWGISFIVGLLMNEYVSYVTEQIHYLGVDFKDVLPQK